MNRFIAILTVGLAGVAAATAGTVFPICGANGLTSSCVTTSNFGERSYINGSSNSTFNGATITGGISGQTGGTLAVNSLPDGFGGGATLTDPTNGVVFNLMNEGTSGSPDEVWTGGGGSMTINIGVFGAAGAYTMLDNRWGIAGNESGTVEFDFSATQGGPIVDDVIYQLINGQEIGTAIKCATQGTILTDANCTGFGTTVQATSNATITGTGISGPTTAAVTANQIWTANYTGGSASYAGTTGTLGLFDQGFNFTGLSNYSTLSGLWLTDMVLTDVNSGGSGSAAPSRIELSALTVETTPEPSAMLLMMAGLGALGLVRRFRRS